MNWIENEEDGQLYAKAIGLGANEFCLATIKRAEIYIANKILANAGVHTDYTEKEFICIFKNVQETIKLRGIITIERIRNEVKSIWDQLEIEEFSLLINSINIDSYPDLKLLPNDSVIVVESKCKAFSSFKKIHEVLDFANIYDVIEDDNQFSKDTNILSSTIDTMVDTIYNDLKIKLVAYNMFADNMKEFISPILVGAIVLLGELRIKMTAAKSISGRLANGKIDYVIVYQNFHLCITIAKKWETEYGIAQNIAQLVASRDVFTYEECLWNRFNYSDINSIPSSGIISSGREWNFSKYVYENNRWQLYLSKSYYLTLDESEYMKNQIKQLLLVIVGILTRQKAKIDELTKDKKQVVS